MPKVTKERRKREKRGQPRERVSEEKRTERKEKGAGRILGNRVLPWQQKMAQRVNQVDLLHLNNNLDVRQRRTGRKGLVSSENNLRMSGCVLVIFVQHSEADN